MDQQLSDDRPLLLFFLADLRDCRDVQDALYVELDYLYNQVKAEYKHLEDTDFCPYCKLIVTSA